MLKRVILAAAIALVAASASAQFDFRSLTSPRYEIRGTAGYPATTCASNWGCIAYDYTQQAFVCSTNGGGWGVCVFGTTGGGGSGVTAFNGRTGLVIPTAGDYTGGLVGVTSPGSGITATDVQSALNQLAARPAGISSFNTRTGAVVSVGGDYDVTMITGAAPIASPAFTGVPSAPTAVAGTNTSQLATTAFVTSAIALYSGVCTNCATTNTVQTFTAGKNLSMQVGGANASSVLAVVRPTTGSGTVTVSATGTAVTGTTTNFVSFVEVGEQITLSDGQQRQVTAIASDTAMTVTPAWTSTCTTCTYTVVAKNPLAVRNNAVMLGAPIMMQSTDSTGYANFPAQSSNAPTPASGFNIFSPATGKFAWKTSTGFAHILQGPPITADRTYTLPDISGTFEIVGAARQYVEFAPQAVAPSTPAAGFRLYANATGKLAWKGTNGFQRVFDGTANTADRTYTLPDADGTFALLSVAQTFSAANRFSTTVNIGAATNLAPLTVSAGNVIFGAYSESARFTDTAQTSGRGISLGYDNTTSGGILSAIGGTGKMEFWTGLANRFEVSSAGVITAHKSLSFDGTAGSAYIDLFAQNPVPSAPVPSNTLRVYSGATDDLEWITTGNARVRLYELWPGQSRSFQLPNADGTFSLIDVAQTFTAKKTFDLGATPATSQIALQANGLGALALLDFAADNGNILFDADFVSSAFVARHAVVYRIVKNGSVFGIGGSSGNTLGGTATFNPLFQLDATGNAVITGTIKERSRSVGLGEWTTFTPTMTASAGTWTGGTASTAKYTLVGKTMTVALYITGTSVSATPASLSIAIPGGFTSANLASTNAQVLDNGVAGGQRMVRVSAAGTTIDVFGGAFATGTWATATATTAVAYTFSFEIQ